MKTESVKARLEFVLDSASALFGPGFAVEPRYEAKIE